MTTPSTVSEGQVPFAYRALKMLDATERVANEVPTTVMRPARRLECEGPDCLGRWSLTCAHKVLGARDAEACDLNSAEETRHDQTDCIEV